MTDPVIDRLLVAIGVYAFGLFMGWCLGMPRAAGGDDNNAAKVTAKRAENPRQYGESAG